MFEIEIFIAISMILSGTPANAFVCPTVAEMWPCTCQYQVEVHCSGNDVTQDVLNRVLATIRRENNQTLELHRMYVSSTNLVDLDLAPFEGGRILYGLHIQNNRFLSSIIGPQLNATNWNPIQADYIRLFNNNFEDEGLQTMLSYFNRTKINGLDLGVNKLRGTLGPEFLPGFSDLSNMTNLDLEYNNIRVLGGGQFRGMKWMSGIYLHSNGLEEIGEDAFAIDEVWHLPLPPPLDEFYIDLRNNSLSYESFHPNTGIANLSISIGATAILLEDNQFRTVKEDLFLDFLDVPGNQIYFERNPIWCDPNMKWLKDRREDLEWRVTGLYCVNDPGETAFTSSCVDGNCPGITEGTTTEYNTTTTVSITTSTTTTVTTTTTRDTTTTDTTTPVITTTEQITTTGGPIPDCPPYEPSNPPTFYPGISCDTYYMCTEQGPILLNCPPPLLWDQSLKTCAPPEEVDCEMKLTLK